MYYLQEYALQRKPTFNIIARKNEVKTMANHTSCDCKCKLNITTCNSNRKWNIMKYVNVKVKIIVTAKKVIVGILAHTLWG